ncbi:MAG: SGNH/GDSL hydrolase family protein [Proteobacteria bacterium]|nr:SGNH/GDSL hydrolase family protein [Pseudomonadota bacterium]
MNKKKKYFLTILVFLSSVLFALLISEAIIRIVRPDIKSLVETHFVKDRFRIRANPRNLLFVGLHPDSREKHPIAFNSIGARQHRDFKTAKRPGTTRIGIFGDSYTANLRMRSEYSFTEPLEYLLNRTGRDFEVINFGTDAYGTGQIYLQYMDEGLSMDLDVVVYLFFVNDIKEILSNGLIDMDDAGKIRYVPVKETPLSTRVAKRFYLTYFLIEAFAKMDLQLDFLLTRGAQVATDEAVVMMEESKKRYAHFQGLLEKGLTDSDLERAKVIFQAIVVEMSMVAKKNGQPFYVMLVPMGGDVNMMVKDLLKERGIDAHDLYPEFMAEKQSMDEFIFRSDPHWNEEGNKVAASRVMRYLVGKLALTDVDDRFIREGLFEYYSAFTPSLVSGSLLSEVEVAPERLKAIRGRYTSSYEVKGPGKW